jgi:hypothetical protein
METIGLHQNGEDIQLPHHLDWDSRLSVLPFSPQFDWITHLLKVYISSLKQELLSIVLDLKYEIKESLYPGVIGDNYSLRE